MSRPTGCGHCFTCVRAGVTYASVPADRRADVYFPPAVARGNHTVLRCKNDLWTKRMGDKHLPLLRRSFIEPRSDMRLEFVGEILVSNGTCIDASFIRDQARADLSPEMKCHADNLAEIYFKHPEQWPSIWRRWNKRRREQLLRREVEEQRVRLVAKIQRHQAAQEAKRRKQMEAKLNDPNWISHALPYL